MSAKTKYAVRGLVELSLHAGVGVPMRVTDIAAGRDLPEHFLEQAFSLLRRAGLLRSRRGAGGGFAFGRPPELITVLDVCRVLDGEVATPAIELSGLEDAGSSALDSVWRRANEAYLETLASTTIADLAERERHLSAGQPMYEI